MQSSKSYGCTAEPPCNVSYTSKKSYLQHMRLEHNATSAKANVRCIYDKCYKNFITVAALRKHLVFEHKVEMEEEHHTFESYDEFLEWKSNLEYLSTDRYIKQWGDKMIFNCRRRGFYKPAKKDKKEKESKPPKMKSQGSCKMNGHCTSQIVVHMKDGKYEIQFHKTHVGHDSMVCNSTIDRKTKRMIYGLLLKGLEPRKILEKLQSRNDTERNYYLKLRDVLNIQNATSIVNIENGQLHTDDATSVDLFVDEHCHSGEVIIYKPKRAVDPKYPELMSSDFVFGLMTDIQISWCDQLENEFSVVCVDATHGMGNGFKMITVLTINEFYQGLPLAFCISRTETATVLRAFFEAIKKRVGKRLIRKYFMSDDAEYYFATWKSVMDPDNSLELKHWLCAWHVNQAWKKNLRSKVRGEDKQKEVKSRLYDLRYETNLVKYNEKLAKFHEDINGDPHLETFYNYLVINYFPRIEKWAFVFRDVNSLTTNTHLEAFHKTFKEIYLKRRSNIRVDFNIEMLTRFIEDKQRAYRTAQVFGLNNRKNSHVLKNHLEAESELFQWECESYDVEDQEQHNQVYLLSCKNGNEVFALQNIKKLDNVHQCFLTCVDCKTCFHHYSCSCDDYVINHNFCKHSHLLRLQLVKQMQNIHKSSTHQDTNVDYDNQDGFSGAETDDAPECPEGASESSREVQSYLSVLNSDLPVITKESVWNKIKQMNVEFQSQLAVSQHEDPSLEALQHVMKQFSQLIANFKNLPKESDPNFAFTPKKKSSKRKADLQIRFSPKKSKRGAKQKRKLF